MSTNGTFEYYFQQQQMTTDYEIEDLMQGCYDSRDYPGQCDNKGPASVTTTTTFEDVGFGSPSVLTEDGSTSFIMMAHKRTYSDHSNGTSGGGSDSQLLSMPDEDWGGNWGSGAEFSVDNETKEDDTSAAMPHDPNIVLTTLSTSGICVVT
jgi:hypothetical protein